MKESSKCAACLGAFTAKRRGQSFCSARCRFLSWAAHALLDAYRAGQADGLREVIGELKEIEP